jgi:hypothetical protein
MKIIFGILLLAAPAAADTLSIDPVMGTLGFTGKQLGDWSVGYEHRLDVHHAVLVEQTTVHVHEDPFHLTQFGLGAGYRYFVRDGSSPFVGGLVGARLGTGRYGEMGDLSGRGVYATAHAGWRWTRDPVVVTARLGAGYAYHSLGDAPAEALAEKDDHLAPLPFEIDSELSVGWQF